MRTLVSAIKIFFTLANLCFVSLFLLSCLAPFISPAQWWEIAFLGLLFPLLAVANIFWIIFWLIFRKKRALMSAAALALGWWNISNHFSFHRAASPPENSFSVLSFNVKVFDLYNWTHNTASKDAILRLITGSGADVVCLQEFYTDNSETFDIVSSLTKQYPYFHFYKTLTLYDHNHWGIATFSKHPIVNREAMPFSNSIHNVCIATDVQIGIDTVRFFNAHLQSIHFGRNEYEGLRNPDYSRKTKEAVWGIYYKLKEAFLKRASQSELLGENIAGSPHPVVVCGDFNDSPNSHTYRTLSENLSDSFKACGSGLGATYPARWPVLRIDYILYSKNFSAVTHRVLSARASDHRAVLASFGWN